ncbi:MAG TPA: hypothetical protein VFZ58_00360 [Candidatus Saccharimonadales bacterium]
MVKNTKLKKASREHIEAAKKLKRQKWIAFWIAIYWISLFVPFISPYTKYPVYIIICGGRLPLVGTNFAAAYSYAGPGDATYELTPFDTHLFCSDEEAARAGFHRRY